MSSRNTKGHASLCLFTFSDGRRCRTPRITTHPHFCLYHAQKEAQSLATQKLSNELAYFFSGSYLAACDLSTALSRIIPAVIRGDVKPKTARTVAYLAQTLLQSIRVSQHEYINAYGTDFWRGAVQDSVKSDRDYLFPPKPAPKPAPPSAPPPNATVPSPPTPPISTVATSLTPPTVTPAPSPAPPRAPQTPARPPQASTPKNCHSEHSQEEPAFPSSPAPSPIPAQQLSSTPSSLPPQPSAVAHPFRSNALPPQVRRRFHRSTGAVSPSPSAQQTPQTSPPTAQPSPSAPHLAQTGRPTGSTTTLSPAPAQTANPFRINTSTPTSELLILNHLHHR